ncbi:hypothetical protein SDC9_115520 [bioreactor metagenome]|uniref:Uncharacterized protein n=1 Tax=bioreactor metagenome TaxID=1076179 RepID=A0A645BT83_9ZZZZ
MDANDLKDTTIVAIPGSLGEKIPGAVLCDAGLLDTLLRQKRLPKNSLDPSQMTYRSSTGELELDRRNTVFRMVTPQCETFILPVKQRGSGNFLSVDNQIGHGVFSALSLDGKALTDSKRILLLHLTDALPTKMKFTDRTMRRLESWGEVPFLARRGEAAISFVGSGFQLYALNSAGKRLAEIPLSVKNGSSNTKLSVFNPFGQVFAYELLRNPKK